MIYATNTYPREWFWPKPEGRSFVCRYCGGEFQAKSRNQVVCSAPECRQKQTDLAHERARLSKRQARRER